MAPATVDTRPVIWSALVWLDKVANWTLGWAFGGGLHPWGLTLSDRFYLLRAGGSWVGRAACSVLDRIQHDHCDNAIKEDQS